MSSTLLKPLPWTTHCHGSIVFMTHLHGCCILAVNIAIESTGGVQERDIFKSMILHSNKHTPTKETDSFNHNPCFVWSKLLPSICRIFFLPKKLNSSLIKCYTIQRAINSIIWWLVEKIVALASERTTISFVVY